MFIGHFALGLAAKKAAPRTSLGTLFIAAQLLDLLWPLFLLLGWENVAIKVGITVMSPLDFTHYPISHSLLMAVAWGFAFGGLYFIFRRDIRSAVVLGICVLSHWMLDLLVHRSDLPLYPGASMLWGFSLWNHPVVEVVIETGLFLCGILIYLKVTKAVNKKGIYGFWSLIVFLGIIYVSSLWGNPPPDVQSIAWVGMAQWLFIIWAYWVDRNRNLV